MERYSDVHALNERGTSSAEVHCFSLSTIIAATDNFSFSKRLGEGGFGTVYKVYLVYWSGILHKFFYTNKSLTEYSLTS